MGRMGAAIFFPGREIADDWIYGAQSRLDDVDVVEGTGHIFTWSNELLLALDCLQCTLGNYRDNNREVSSMRIGTSLNGKSKLTKAESQHKSLGRGIAC